VHIRDRKPVVKRKDAENEFYANVSLNDDLESKI
jgi:hypothetical protein